MRDKVLFLHVAAYNSGMKLEFSAPEYYRLKKGQSLSDVANALRIPPRLLASFNGLEEEPREGRVLRIPKQNGNLYIVKGGESKTLLCGSPECYRQKNGTEAFYPAQVILL